MARAPDTTIVEFRYSRGKTALLVLFTLVLTFGSLIGAAGPGVPFGVRLILACTTVFFGFWLVVMAARLTERGVILSVSPKGIHDKRIGPQVMPWSAMEQVYAFRARSQFYLAVVLTEPERYIAPPTRVDRFAMWTNQTIGLPKVSLSLLGLDGSARQVVQAVRRVLPAKLVPPDRPPGLFGI